MLTTVFPSLKSHDDTAELRRAARAMSATTEDDGTSSEDLSNLLALADENLAGDNLADGVPRADPEIDFADDRARVAALAAIADRAAALPPYAGDDAETDAVFDELLELHASIAATDAWDAPSSLSTEPDAREARLDREALERASVLVDAIAALAGASGSAPDGVVVHADAVKRRLEWSLEEMRTKQKEAVASAQSTVRLRRDALRHALDVADGDDGADDADAVDAVETAFEDAALDAEAAAVAATRSQEARERSARLVAEGGAEGDASALASPSKASESSDDSSRSGSSLDDVIDRELRNQRFVRKQARARAHAKVEAAAAEARRAVEAEMSAASAGARAAASAPPLAAAASASASNVAEDGSASAKENANGSEARRKTKDPLRRRLVRDALVALPVLVISLYDTARGERRRSAGAERAARRRVAADAAAASARSPAKTRNAEKTKGSAPARSPYAIPSSMTMKVGANSYEVENGRVVTLASPAEAREVRKAFGMG